MARKSRFDGKTVVVTGASSGIGRASALAFAREGATTVLASRSEDKLGQVADEIRSFNPRVLVVPTDVSVREQIQRLIDKTVREFGQIDILFNNAGNAYVGAIEEGRFADDLNKMLAVSFSGALYGAQAVLPIMKRQRAGHIVNMSSVVGRKAFPHFGGYSIAMHAISALAALRQELRGTGIAVTTVHPALTQTAMLDEVNPADMPPPFRAMTPRTPEFVATGILNAVCKRQARVVLPSPPRMLLLGDALSPHIGDLIVRLLSRPAFSYLIGVYIAAGFMNTIPRGRGRRMRRHPAQSRLYPVSQRSSEAPIHHIVEETTMYRIKVWKRAKQALTACAQTFVAAGRELVLAERPPTLLATGEEHEDAAFTFE
ncbi:MAG: SDR family NAD(P)-dependent oxidoreductase [Gammaproteobacteria bacterium]